MIESLFSQLTSPFSGEELFDQLADLVYFIKNQQGQYLIVNRTLVERCGVIDKKALIGKTASQVLRAPLGEQFQAQDNELLRTGEPILSRLELHLYPSREVGWCLTTKLPLRGARGRILGLVGVSQDVRIPDIETDAYQQMSTALEYAQKNLSQAPGVEELASVAGMSRYQFDRRMQLTFSLTAQQWLLKLRIGRAEIMLRDRADPILHIAQSVGYTSQSAFSRQFLKTTGFTPRAYRNMHSPNE